MNLFQSKIREVFQSLVPVVIFVSIIALIFIPVNLQVTQRFLLGAIFIFLGLSIFLWGVDQSMEPIGKLMAEEIAKSKTMLFALGLSFLLGFLITVAEPDLLILGGQIESASGGELGSSLIVYTVSVGVGLMISIGPLRLLLSKRYNILMAIIYGIVALLSIFISSQFLAIAFDSSGATTGALTTPFILAISLGLSRIKGGSNEADSFGLVGVMSTGPILAVLLLSIITRQDTIQETSQDIEMAKGVVSPMIEALGHTFMESLIALFPIVALFLIFNIFKFKLKGPALFRIFRGLIYSLIGLTFFLAGANQGFMDMGRLLGMGLAENYSQFLIILGFILGFIIVLAEPAVHVLSDQIEEVTAGAIPGTVISRTLSIGVGLAVALSMVRIMVPAVQLWHFILPGFLLSIILSFYVDPIFVGIAFDSGGVASGPMAATFVLAFAQGVADKIETASVIADGFGVIAMIAMTPVLSIMILGAMTKANEKKKEGYEAKPEEKILIKEKIAREEVLTDLLIIEVRDGLADQIIEYVQGVTKSGPIKIHGRDTRAEAWRKYSFDVTSDLDIIWILLPSDQTIRTTEKILDKFGPLSIYAVQTELMEKI